MARSNPLPALLAGLAIVALIACDSHPALRHVPLLLLVMLGAVQCDRELSNAYAALNRYPSAPSMNFLTSIVVIHMAYFAQPVASSLLELLGTVAVAMYTLVVVAAVSTDFKVYGRRPAAGYFALSIAIPLVIGGGLSCAFFVQSSLAGGPTIEGSRLVALIVASAWLGMAVASRAVSGQVPVNLSRGLLPVLAVVAGAYALGLAAPLGTVRLVGLSLAVGMGTWFGSRVVENLARRCRIQSFRWRLPSQVEFIQPFYNRLFAGGLTDYAAPLAFVMPLALLALRGLGV